MKKLILIVAVILITAQAQAANRFYTDVRTPEIKVENPRAEGPIPYRNDPRELGLAYDGAKLFNEIYK